MDESDTGVHYYTIIKVSLIDIGCIQTSVCRVGEFWRHIVLCSFEGETIGSVVSSGKITIDISAYFISSLMVHLMSVFGGR